jgi:acetyl esterase/lipase
MICQLPFVRARALRLCALIALLPLGGCTGFDVLNAPVSSRGYSRTTDLPYGPIPRQKLDIYVPRNATPNSRVVIFFYGGEWQAGQKGDYRFAGEALSSEGFIAVLPDYRIYPEATFPQFVEDGALAVRWVHDNIASFGGDPTHIYLMGHSAGAHIAALVTLDAHYLKDLGLDRSVIRATAGLAGPYDFFPFDEDRAIFHMKPGDTKPDPNIEPINFVDGHAAPFLAVQGMTDTTCTPNNAFELVAKTRAAGGEADYVTYKNRGHVAVVVALASEFRWLAPVLKDCADYFRRH